MTNNIDMSANTTDFKPIGLHGSVKFKGTFDGDHHVIKNLTVNPIEGHTANDGLALFGSVLSASEIKNLGLINPTVDGGGTLRRVSALVGFFAGGNITNCYVEGGSITGDNDVGSIVGRTGTAAVTISNCYSSATILCDLGNCAGIVGYFTGESSSCSNLVFNGSINRGFPVCNFQIVGAQTVAPAHDASNLIVKDGCGYAAGTPGADHTALDATAIKEESSYPAGFFGNNDLWMIFKDSPTLRSFWAHNILPTDDIVVGKMNQLISDEAICNSLTIESGASLEIKGTGIVTVSGTLTNNAGQDGLILNYNATNKAVLDFTGTVDATIVHTFETAGDLDATGVGTTAWQAFATGLTTSVETGNGTATLTGASGTNRFFVNELDETHVLNDAYSNVSGSLSGTKGYLVYSEEGHTLTVKGTLSGNEQIFSSLSMSVNGFHLLANTMSTKIDVAELQLPVGTFEQAVWVYDGVDSYTTIDALSPSENLKPGTSFVIKASEGAAAADVTIPVSAKTTASAKKDKFTQQEIIIEVEAEQETDLAKIRFLDAALDEKDNYDLSKMFSLNPNKLELFTEVSGMAVHTNTVSANFAGIVPIKVRLGASGTAELNIDRSNFQYAGTVRLWKEGESQLITGSHAVTLNGNPQQELTLELEFGKKALSSDKTAVDGWIKSTGNKKLSVHTNHNTDNMLEVYTMSGKLIHQQQLSGTQNEIELNVESGVYIARLNGKQQIIQKVFIQ